MKARDVTRGAKLKIRGNEVTISAVRTENGKVIMRGRDRHGNEYFRVVNESTEV